MWEHEEAEFICKTNDEELLLTWVVKGQKVTQGQKYQLYKDGCVHRMTITDCLRHEDGDVEAVLGDVRTIGHLTVDGT